MAYAQFTLPEAVKRLGLDVRDNTSLFPNVAEAQPGAWLTDTLAIGASWALAVSTEKARSEMIIAPILLELRRRSQETLGVFSGVEFNVDAELGLEGRCDFLITRTSVQILVRAPVVAVVEAKKEDITGGLGQCAAELAAVQLFNEREGTPLPQVWGAVTSGDVWRFARLSGSLFQVDRIEYTLAELPKILGILLHTALGASATGSSESA